MVLDKSKNFGTKILITVAGIGLFYYVGRNRKRIWNQINFLWSRNPLQGQQIEIINSVDDCVQFTEKLKRHYQPYPVLGFDCEWITVGGKRRPIALLQLATQTGHCGLIRLNKLQQIPECLRGILQNERILKVGVGSMEDSNFLARDYGVRMSGCLDLRYMADLVDEPGSSLAKMAKKFLSVELDKSWRIRCSDWEAIQLTDRQQKYAASDAHVAIELFKSFESKYYRSRFGFVGSFLTGHQTRFEQLWERCSVYLDRKYSNNNVAVQTDNLGVPLNGHAGRSIRTPLYSIREKPLYDNCFLQAPDGELLCTCDRKRAEWYVGKGLGTIVTDQPFTVKLHFEPSGRAEGDSGNFYTQPKENRCVVCGKENSCVRKNIVPREYRKYFPKFLKSHTSHDIVLLCLNCHQKSNISDQRVRDLLNKKCGLKEESASEMERKSSIKHLKSAARALLHSEYKIPVKRQTTLTNIVLDQEPSGTIISDELLRRVINRKEENDESTNEAIPIGKRIVEYFKKLPISDGGGLLNLEQLWRQHFLDTMRPKFMPDFWSIEHNVDRIMIWASKGKINGEDLRLAGLESDLNGVQV